MTSKNCDARTHNQPSARQQSHTNQSIRILRMRDLHRYLGIAKSTAYDWIKKGFLPAPDIRLGRTVGWFIETINAFIDANRCVVR